MKFFLLKGEYTNYVCFADDLIEVQEQLKARYKWANSFKLSMQPVKDSVSFNLSWTEYHNYENKTYETQFVLLLSEDVPSENKLVPQYKNSYF